MKSQWKKQDEQLKRRISLIIAGAGITKEALADLMGISTRTLRNRLKQPSEFKQAELRIVDWLSEKYRLGV